MLPETIDVSFQIPTVPALWTLGIFVYVSLTIALARWAYIAAYNFSDDVAAPPAINAVLAIIFMPAYLIAWLVTYKNKV